MVTDRQDGRERIILLNNNETHGCELLYIDFEQDRGEVFSAPAGSGSWTGIEVPGDRLVIGTFYDGAFVVFDLKARKFITSVKCPDENYIWNVVPGPDGRVYGGTYPGAKLVAMDLKTYAVEDLGAPVLPNQYLRYVSLTPWGQLVAQFGMQKSTTKLYDIAAKEWKDFPGLQEGNQFGIGIVWNGMFVAHDPRSGKLEAFEDASWRPSTKSVLASQEAAGYRVSGQLSNEKMLYLQKGNELYRLSAEQQTFAPTKVTELDLRGGRYVGVSSKGELIGVRGQSYFVVRPGDREIRLRPIPEEPRGRPTLFLAADDQGRIWGGPHFGQTLFSYDTKTGKTINTDVVCDAGGEVYGATMLEGRVYSASYSGGDITCYDPTQPWNQWDRKNPKPLASVTPGYIRPQGGIVTGPDGKLYAGWMARYGTYGGAISITDPATGQTELIENPLGEQAIESFAVDHKRIYIGTSLGANGLPKQKGPAYFGVIELASREVLFKQPYETASVSRLIKEPRSGRIAFVVDMKLHVYDPDTGRIIIEPITDLPPIWAKQMLSLGDGTLLAGCKDQICRLDLAKNTYRVLAESPGTIGSMVLGSDRRIYFSNKADLYRTTAAVADLE